MTNPLICEHGQLRRQCAHCDDAREIAELRKAVEYYRAIVDRRRPQWVPSVIALTRQVRGDFPIGHKSIADAGVHQCMSNQQGAVSVIASDGHTLGIKPSEFDVIEWRPNADADATPTKE